MSRDGPLAGVTIVDLTRVLAGPFCTLILSDLGARVIKVEMPGHGDDTRAYGPFVAGVSTYFVSLNRGKESIALDFNAPADRAVLDRLLGRADVLIENFRPGTLERKGYGWDALQTRFPRLVYAAISGFGRTGPYHARPAYDLVVQAMGGLMSLTGEPGGPPQRAGVSIGDLAAGLYAAIGILAALRQRDATGRGTLVDVAMLDCQVALLENAVARHGATGEVPGRTGTHHSLIAPFGAFATQDESIIVAVGNDALFANLCGALGRAELATDPRYADNESRALRRMELAREIEGILKTAPARVWLARLEAAGVPSGPINSVDALMADPQVAARHMLAHMRDPVAGELRVAGNPIKIEGLPDPVERAPAPALDADRAAILAEFARDER